MELKERLFLAITKLFPARYRKALEQQIIYSGEHINASSYLGSTTLLALLSFTGTLLIPYAFSRGFEIKYLIFGTIIFILIELTAYLLIYFKAEDRTKRVEEVLPDALQLIASNIRAGMTPFRALKLAARKELGPLKEEIEHATAKSLGIESFSRALLSISERINSEILERAMKLFTTAMRSGGHLATLLEELAKDIEETKSLKKDLVTSTKTYTAFIMFTIIIGAPLLLAISIHFIKVITAMQAKAGTTTAGFGLGMLAGEIVITADFLTNMAISMLIITGLLASILLGVIAEGKPKHGFRYAPLIITGSLVIFVVLRYAVANFFGGII
tara:strand:- start:3027 stop:4016 length:990 start_codon:yes stop_codon:yes gene_type:complete